MATVTRGSQDDYVRRIQATLGEYEKAHPGAVASLYRQNAGSIRVRVIDARFAGATPGQRHDAVWRFMADRLSDDDLQEISVLLLLAPDERPSSFLNAEFEDPIPSRL